MKQWNIEVNDKCVKAKVKKFVDLIFLPIHGFLAYMFVNVFYAFLMFDLFPEKFGEITGSTPAMEAVIAHPIFIWLPALMATLKMVKIFVTDFKSVFFGK